VAQDETYRAAGDNALHVVCQNSSRNTVSQECMDHSDEQVLLLGIRKKLDVAGSAVMAHRREARCAV